MRWQDSRRRLKRYNTRYVYKKNRLTGRYVATYRRLGSANRDASERLKCLSRLSDWESWDTVGLNLKQVHFIQGIIRSVEQNTVSPQIAIDLARDVTLVVDKRSANQILFRRGYVFADGGLLTCIDAETQYLNEYAAWRKRTTAARIHIQNLWKVTRGKKINFTVPDEEADEHGDDAGYSAKPVGLRAHKISYQEAARLAISMHVTSRDKRKVAQDTKNLENYIAGEAAKANEKFEYSTERKSRMGNLGKRGNKRREKGKPRFSQLGSSHGNMTEEDDHACVKLVFVIILMIIINFITRAQIVILLNIAGVERNPGMPPKAAGATRAARRAQAQALQALQPGQAQFIAPGNAAHLVAQAQAIVQPIQQAAVPPVPPPANPLPKIEPQQLLPFGNQLLGFVTDGDIGGRAVDINILPVGLKTHLDLFNAPAVPIQLPSRLAAIIADCKVFRFNTRMKIFLFLILLDVFRIAYVNFYTEYVPVLLFGNWMVDLVLILIVAVWYFKPKKRLVDYRRHSVHHDLVDRTMEHEYRWNKDGDNIACYKLVIQDLQLQGPAIDQRQYPDRGVSCTAQPSYSHMTLEKVVCGDIDGEDPTVHFVSLYSARVDLRKVSASYVQHDDLNMCVRLSCLKYAQEQKVNTHENSIVDGQALAFYFIARHQYWQCRIAPTNSLWSKLVHASS